VASYAFRTEWHVPAPIDRVFELLHDSLAWPEWWPAVTAVEQMRPATGGATVGSVLRYTFKGKLPYTLTFDMLVDRDEPPTSIGGRASGELEGTGLWTLREEGGVTIARYDWNIRTTAWWMNLLAPLAGGAFRSNHDYVMRSGAEGIGRRLGVPVQQTELHRDAAA
jgi:hypothetical protein